MKCPTDNLLDVFVVVAIVDQCIHTVLVILAQIDACAVRFVEVG